VWRQDLELANDGLFIENIKSEYTEAETGLIVEALTLFRSLQPTAYSSIKEIAQLLADQKADANVVLCAFLAPLLWENFCPLSEIEEKFGHKPSQILSHFILPPICRTDTEVHRHTDTQTLLSVFSGNIEQTILFLAFRTAELEQNINESSGNYKKLADEALDFLVPVASRLNLGKLRRRLEKAAFRLTNPTAYAELESRVEPIQADDNECLAILKNAVYQVLSKHRIKAEIQGRIKSLYSIHSKMQRTGKSFEEILDRLGLRIIVKTVPQCYSVLGLIHTHYQPVPNSFDDYVGLPKDNGYQSLHTCVYPVRNISHKPIEFQIRTELMHKEAEYGVAAHWQYKEKGKEIAEDDYQKTLWMKGLAKQHHNMTSKDFISMLHKQMHEDAMVVFGNAGQILRLPEKSTVSHYLEKANITCAPGTVIKVNGVAISLNHILSDGDSIEVLPLDKGAENNLPQSVNEDFPKSPGAAVFNKSPPLTVRQETI